MYLIISITISYILSYLHKRAKIIEPIYITTYIEIINNNTSIFIYTSLVKKVFYLF